MHAVPTFVALCFAATAPRVSAKATAAEKACASGSAQGCSDLADLLDEGDGLPRDSRREDELYRRACDGGIALACEEFAFNVAEGKGAPKDRALAAAYYQKACEGGDGVGCWYLGLAYADGAGVRKSAANAASSYQRGCELGSGSACHNFSQCLARGIGVPRDAARAKALMDRAYAILATRVADEAMQEVARKFHQKPTTTPNASSFLIKADGCVYVVNVEESFDDRGEVELGDAIKDDRPSTCDGE